jgi:hypothetical protein
VLIRDETSTSGMRTIYWGARVKPGDHVVPIA